MQNSGFSRPTLPQLIDTIRGDLLTRFNEDSVLRCLDVKCTQEYRLPPFILYGYIDYLALNILPDLADEDWLTGHSNIKRCPRKGATKASGFVRWEGVQNALSMPADTAIHRDDGQIYTTTASATSAKGVLRVPVVAKSSGQAGNCEDAIALRLATPISGLSSTGYADKIRTGTDTEHLDSWRQRIMARWYNTPQGGADSDYVRWGKEVLGISRAWTHRNKNGIGTIGVMVASDYVDHPAPHRKS